MEKSLIRRLQDLIKKPQKQLNPGLDLEKIYKDEIDKFQPSEREKVIALLKESPFIDFQFDEDELIYAFNYNGDRAFSIEYVKRMFENQAMFDMFLSEIEKAKTNKNQERISVKEVRAFEETQISISNKQIYPVEILRTGYEIYGMDKSKMEKGVRKKIEKLEKAFSVANILKRKEKNFCAYINGEKISVPKKDLLNLLTENDEHFEARFVEKNEDENYKLLVALKQFLAQGNREPVLLQKYAFLEKDIVRYEYIEEKKLPMLQSKRLATAKKTAYSDQITIHPKLREAVLKDMPSNLLEIEKAIYLYERLCQILVYDSQFFVDNTGKRLEKHSNLMRLSTITPENNTIICYEFAYIYAKFLEEQGINHEIRFGNTKIMNKAKTEGDKGTYGGNVHAYCVAKADDVIFTADSTTSSFGGDLINAKVGRELEGLDLVNLSDEDIEKFTQAYQNVRQILQEQENNIPQSDLLKTYRTLVMEDSREKYINVEEKVKLLEKLLNSAGKAKGLENYYYLYRISKTFIR